MRTITCGEKKGGNALVILCKEGGWEKIVEKKTPPGGRLSRTAPSQGPGMSHLT